MKLWPRVWCLVFFDSRCRIIYDTTPDAILMPDGRTAPKTECIWPHIWDGHRQNTQLEILVTVRMALLPMMLSLLCCRTITRDLWRAGGATGVNAAPPPCWSDSIALHHSALAALNNYALYKSTHSSQPHTTTRHAVHFNNCYAHVSAISSLCTHAD